MILFNVSSLLTNVPLDYTIDVILRFIYTEREIETNITKKELEYLLILCTKNAHFSFNGQLYLQKDGGSYGLAMRTRYSRYVHSRIRKKFTTNVISVDDKLEAVCRWYHFVCKSWLHWKYTKDIEFLPCKYFLYLWARMRWYDFLLRCFNYEKEQYHRNHRLL